MENIKSTKAFSDAELERIQIMRDGLTFLKTQQKGKEFQVKITPKFVELRTVGSKREIKHIKTTSTIDKMINYIDNLAEQQKMGYKKVVK